MSDLHPRTTAEAPLPTTPVGEPESAPEVEHELSRRFWFFHVMPSWMVSFFAHIALVIFLAIWLMPELKDKTVSLEAGDQLGEAVAIDVNLDEMDFSETDPFESEISEALPTEMPDEREPLMVEDVNPVDFGDFSAADLVVDETDLGELGQSDLANETSSRSAANKQAMLRKFGGSAASERAVAMALKWIADHQLEDGGWSFDHRIGPGNFRTSPNPGALAEARNGATAMALLPFLGNGQTHVAGEYKDTVRRGLEFLMSRASRQFRGLSYNEPGGTMYSHGLVSIVFCEAFAMTQDEQLAKYAQGTIWFIEDAQDPNGGGWRYTPKQRGDTSAVGWQLMALKSGRLSGLNIDSKTLALAARFLDYVSIKSGAYYGYDEPPRAVTAAALGRTAIGLLCRMYMGWDRSTPALVEGVEWISEEGPSVGPEANMYYNYYATQLMKHYGGERWDQWNGVMREFLIKSQSQEGVTKGSWMFAPRSHSGDRGGRLYTTSLACMTLEVYYRYLPLYDDGSVEDAFPLD